MNKGKLLQIIYWSLFFGFIVNGFFSSLVNLISMLEISKRIGRDFTSSYKISFVLYLILFIINVFGFVGCFLKGKLYYIFSYISLGIILVPSIGLELYYLFSTGMILPPDIHTKVGLIPIIIFICAFALIVLIINILENKKTIWNKN